MIGAACGSAAAPLAAPDAPDAVAVAERVAALVAEVSAALGADRVASDPPLCAILSEDIAGPGAAPAAAVLRPRSPAEVARCVAAARARGLAVLPRGGGMSYTGGYLAAAPGAVLLDLRGLDRVIEIDRDGRTVTVEAGCSWATLHAALAAEGLRTPFFGPLSGLAATVGGSLSQNGMFFGSATHGYAADSVLGLELADGTGALRRVGAWGAGRDAALPRFGPDLVGPFLGDCGALGIKTQAVLRLIPVPPAPRFLSFAFDDGDAVLEAMVRLRDLPHLAEVWAFDAETHRTLARTGFSVIEAAGIAADLAGRSRSLFGAVRDLASAATMRRAVLADLAWSLHLVVEPPLPALAEPLAEAAAAACIAAGGRAMPDTIPRVTRARPFRTIKALIGPDGERWLPCHAVFPAARAAAGLQAVTALLQAEAATMAQEGVRVSLLLVSAGDEVVIEPQLFWPDALGGFQRAHAPEAQVAAHAGAAARPAARALALRLRGALSAAMVARGAAQMQIGRAYRYAADLSPGMAGLLAALKAELDPDGILNPEVLGLPLPARG